MAVLVVPTSAGVPHFAQETDLDGVSYRFDVDWNEREGAWYLTLSLTDGTVIRAGVKLVANWPLLRKVRHADRPPGELMVIDQAGAGITLDNLGVDVVLVYIDAAGVAGG